MSGGLPAVTPRKLIAALERAGFVIERTSGSHYLLRHTSDPARSVTVAYHATDLKPKTLRAALRQAELSVEELIELL
jgi:predicted RNA binding protein YcfA (HicA-like mRNA interferase family)